VSQLLEIPDPLVPLIEELARLSEHVDVDRILDSTPIRDAKMKARYRALRRNGLASTLAVEEVLKEFGLSYSQTRKIVGA